MYDDGPRNLSSRNKVILWQLQSSYNVVDVPHQHANLGPNTHTKKRKQGPRVRQMNLEPSPLLHLPLSPIYSGGGKGGFSLSWDHFYNKAFRATNELLTLSFKAHKICNWTLKISMGVPNI